MKLKAFAIFLAAVVITIGLFNLFSWTVLSRLTAGDSDLIACSQKGIYYYAKDDVSGQMASQLSNQGFAIIEVINTKWLELLISEPINIQLKGKIGIKNKGSALVIYYPLLLNLILPCILFWYAHRRSKKKKEEEDETPSPSCV